MEVADGGEGVVAGGAQLVAWQWDLEWCTQLVLRLNRNQTVYSYDKMHLRIIYLDCLGTKTLPAVTCF